MLRRKATRSMSDERFATWFEQFQKPYTQTKFIHSYKALENAYSELVIRHLLTYVQRRRVERFLNALPKMGRRRFSRFFQRFKQDPGVLYQYSMKDFTKRQRLLIRLCLLKHMLERHLE